MSDDWNSIITDNAPAEGAASPPSGKAAPNNMPPFPQGFGYMVGRLPIKGDTAKAIVQLPEKLKGISCAAVLVNSGVLSDCYKDGSKVCAPTALSGRPINDREIAVFTDAPGDEVVRGPGWVVSGYYYPGALPTTRPVEVGVPYVEVMVIVGPDCGCDGENWADDNEWGQ
ncbi:hypothetical protein IL38_24120 [Actinopolyspora erythraea]|uniref:Uncharacterized protein n=1 Tax=Actinopolyspora erythraea TaxID=414996 RepID=A0ABR4WYD1_9ACTN|nr:hypothetical protein [Actinopolyspora erythraea]KGI79385.1 hypothetical protein IL38_24120 [Actinopolyspora erythraea]